MKMKKWSSQWTQFMQLRKEDWKKNSGLQRGLNPWPRYYLCDALPSELWSHWRWEQVAISCNFLSLYIFILGYLDIIWDFFFSRKVILTHPRSWKGESKEKSVNKIVVRLQCQDRRTLNKLKKTLVIWHSNALLWKWCLFVDLAESYAVSNASLLTPRSVNRV